MRAAGPDDESRARELAARLGRGLDGGSAGDASDVPDMPVASPAAAPGPVWSLFVEGPRRVLVRPDGVRLEIDFTAGRTAARGHERGLVGQPLARALGIPRLRRRFGHLPSIVDATGGLGRDAWFAASLGCRVCLIERSPLVHAMLDAALARARATPGAAEVAGRVTLRHADAVVALADVDPELADVVYLDPMYPATRRRAAVNKGMQFLHELLGPPDGGEATLLAGALEAARRQVTVKRPAGAPPLPGTEAFGGQRETIASPGTRYDLYLRPGTD